MIRKMLLCYLILIFTTAILSAESRLIPCPDCGREVSPRAFMCPNCGCNGEAISSLAKTVAGSSEITGDVLWVSFGKKKSKAYPVEIDGRKFAVFALDEALGADYFVLYKEDERIEGHIPELAVEAPLVRLQLTKNDLVMSSVKSVSSKLPDEQTIYPIEGQEWMPIQPREMKHLKILETIRTGAVGEELPFRTHPYFKYLESKWRKEVKE